MDEIHYSVIYILFDYSQSEENSENVHHSKCASQCTQSMPNNNSLALQPFNGIDRQR